MARPLTNALQNFMMSKQARQQEVAQQQQQDRQAQTRDLLGQMVMGGDPGNLAQVNPEAFIMGQNYLQQQQQGQASARQNALVSDLRRQYAETQDPEVLRQLMAVDTEAASKMQEQMGIQDEQGRTQAINQATAFAQVVQNNPDQAMEYYAQNLADNPAFQGIEDELQAGDYEGVLQGIGVGITALGGQDAYKKFKGLSDGSDIGTYNPRDYTVESFSEFVRTDDPSVLERYYPMKQTNIGGTTYFSDDQGNLFLPASPQVQQGAAPPEPGQSQQPAGPAMEPEAMTPEAQALREADRTRRIEQARREAAAEADAASPEATEQRRLKAQEAERSLDLINRLINADLSGITGKNTRIPGVRSYSAATNADQLNDMNTLTSLLTLGNMGRMSGVLSESDIRILADAASGLNVDQYGTPVSEERVKEILRDASTRIESGLTSFMDGGGTPTDEAPAEPSGPVNWSDL